MRSIRRDTNLPLWALALLALAVAFTLTRYNQERLPMSLGLDTTSEPQASSAQPLSKTEELIQTLQSRIRRVPANLDSYALLGNAYLQRVRETGDPSYYGKAEAALKHVLSRDPQHIEGLIGAGGLALARHDFQAALSLGQQAQALNPTVPRIYGVIGDAQIELGQYDAAVQTIQHMVDLRPDLSSYSRVSYVRELYGDLPGAIEAMQSAVVAGGPTAENTQWALVQLGNLCFAQGDLATAEHHYQAALTRLPEYVHAQAGLARVRAAQGRYGEAIELYTAATKRMPVPEYVIALGDVYTKQGDQQRAQRQYELITALDQLFTTNGVNTDLETALFFADHDLNLADSLQKARAAYAARPSIHAADVLAWTLYKQGQYAKAQQYSAAALRLGTRDALKLFHAGMIANALGQPDQARSYLQQAVALNPHFSLRYGELAATTLTALGGQGAGKGIN